MIERFMPRPREAARMTAAELREAFLLEGLFQPGGVRMFYTDMDRLIAAGIVPQEEIRLTGDSMLGTAYFTERRELGLINLGGPGVVRVGGAAFEIGRASRRRISRCIHPGGAASCQLVMGFTELEAGSVWNTMPPHTHSRRSEIYLYFDLGDGVVVHRMGEPSNTRHLIVRDREAVLSPPWSIHSGAGTRSYGFVWGMAGENQDFGDMDAVPAGRLA